MRKIELGKSGENITIIGQGTWGIEKNQDDLYYKTWIDSLKAGIEHGTTMIDTAEVYGNGASEKTVGEAIKQFPRDNLFIASKVSGFHQRHDQVKKACDQSLKNLGIKTIDLYQVHWPNPFRRLSQTMKAMEELVEEGKIRYIGISNFPVWWMKKVRDNLKKNELVSNQIRISVMKPSAIKKQLPYAKKEGITLIAWSPLNRFGLKGIKPNLRSTLEKIGKDRNLSIHQVALAWLITHENIQAIPKAMHNEHAIENAAVGDIKLTESEMNTINKELKL